jgi:hypothetical protein
MKTPMTIQEYNDGVLRLENKMEQEKRALVQEYCLSNNTVEVGDFFTDHIGTVKVDVISIAGGSWGTPPCCVYAGFEYTKKMQPYKSQSRRKAWQSNEKKS